MDLSWQLKCSSITERNEHLFATGFGADCTFQIGPNGKIFLAHKLILSAASPVFEKMFYGEMAQQSPIIIEDLDENDFFDLLNFVYCHTVNIISIEKAQNLMLAGQRFMLDQLVKKCSLFIAGNLKANNVLSNFEFAKHLDNVSLVEACLDYIRSNASSVLMSPDILTVRIDTLATIVNQSSLYIQSELELFNALHKYAKYHGYFLIHSDNKDNIQEESRTSQETLVKQVQSTEQKEPNEANELKLTRIVPATENKNFCLEQNFSINDIRSQFESFQKIVKKIRFLTMTSIEFSNGPAFSKLLQPADALAILACIVNPQISPDKFPKGFVDSRKTRRQ